MNCPLSSSVTAAALCPAVDGVNCPKAAEDVAEQPRQLPS